MSLTNGSDILSNQLETNLLDGQVFPFPTGDVNDPAYNAPSSTNNPLYATITKLQVSDLTTGALDGTGIFDLLMVSINAQLKDQFQSNRITGSEYTKAYIASIEAALSGSIQFLLGKDQAFYQAMNVQAQGRLTEVQAIVAKVQLLQAKIQAQATKYDALTSEANYNLTKIKLAGEDINYASSNYTLTYLLPNQKLLLDKQIALTDKQVTLTAEQVEAARAQTMDTRTDGTTVITGSVGKQKALYDQQITSYKRDAETKFAKMLADVFTVQKTIDEGLTPPDIFTNASTETVFTKLQTNLALNT